MIEAAVHPATMTKTQLRSSVVKESTEVDTSKEWRMFKGAKPTPCLTATSDESMSLRGQGNFFEISDRMAERHKRDLGRQSAMAPWPLWLEGQGRHTGVAPSWH